MFYSDGELFLEQLKSLPGNLCTQSENITYKILYPYMFTSQLLCSCKSISKCCCTKENMSYMHPIHIFWSTGAKFRVTTENITYTILFLSMFLSQIICSSHSITICCLSPIPFPVLEWWGKIKGHNSSSAKPVWNCCRYTEVCLIHIMHCKSQICKWQNVQKYVATLKIFFFPNRKYTISMFPYPMNCGWRKDQEKVWSINSILL